MFVPISAFLVCLVSAVSHGEEVARFLLTIGLFLVFFANFAAIKKLFPEI